MFGKLLLISLGIIFGLLLIFRTEDLSFLSWAIRHNVDEKGRKELLNALRFVGVLLIALCIWAIFEFVV